MMDRARWIRSTAIIVVVAVFSVLGYWLAPRRASVPPLVEPRLPSKAPTTPAPAPAGPKADPAPPAAATPPPGPPETAAALSPEKAARVERIKRDYDDVRTKAAADYAAAGKDFPGGLNGFLRQLALLEREKRADLAAVLSPRELEDLELKESTTGQMVTRILNETGATEEQRRAVFRLQREFDDRFALTFDLSPAALLEREAARYELNQKIRAAVGETVFLGWLRGEATDYAPMAELVRRQGLAGQTSIELWQTRCQFTIRRLEINAATNMSNAQRRNALSTLVQQTELRLIGIIGAGSLQLERDSAFQWLPKP